LYSKLPEKGALGMSGRSSENEIKRDSTEMEEEMM
jgi:hypothetical protein